MPENSLIVELKDVDLFHGTRQLLQQISLQLRTGELLTVIGPNGAGKTTLLRVVLGLLLPSAGSVFRRTGISIGYMPQRLQIDPTFPLTVRRFLAMAGKSSRGQALPLLREVGVAQVIDEPLQTLSGGELQRVLLARTLLRDPDLLVLDEPVQGVDVHGQMEFYQLITRVREQRRCAVLMVSHDLHLVMAATDRVVCLNRHICCSGTPDAVSSDPAYLEQFGPQAARYLAVYSHDRSHRHDACVNCLEDGHVR